MIPRSEMLEQFFRFDGKGSKPSIEADICIGPDWLSVADINKQLPEMPNNMADDAEILVFSEEHGDEKNERVFGGQFAIDGYMTCTLSKNPNKVVGCLRFSVNFHHTKAKELRIYIDLKGVSVAKKIFAECTSVQTWGCL
jgi:hypothetical protein